MITVFSKSSAGLAARMGAWAARAALALTLAAGSVVPAQAVTQELDMVEVDLTSLPSNSFFAQLGTVTLTGSPYFNLSGSVTAATSLEFGPPFSSVTLDTVFITDSGRNGYLVSGSSFNYSNLAAGTYTIWAQGTFQPDTGSYPGVAFLTGSVNYVAAVPEPETYAMMLSGLVVVGAVARRRRKG